jgi:hypothetical protein
MGTKKKTNNRRALFLLGENGHFGKKILAPGGAASMASMSTF